MSRQPARRPTLLPTVRRLWRGPHRLQLGTDPARAVVLELDDPVHARLLDLLDGSHTERGLIRAARLAGITSDDAAALLRTLTAAGYVVDARTLELARASEPTRRRLAGETSALALRTDPSAAMRRRLQAQVLVTGWSRLAVPIACILAASGVGHVDPDQSGIVRVTDATPGGLLPTDAHRPRGVAAAEALRRVAPDLEVTPLRRTRATFVVLVGFSAPASLTALSYARRRLAHLAVSVRDGTVVVGPLVQPGSSPCLNCLDLHRADRDPDWHAVAAQLHTGPDLPEPVAATTALSGAAYAAFEVLTHIDGGQPATLGATVEISEPGQTTRRQWSQHPGCGCRRSSRSRRGEHPARLP
jgi:bacteriocin biosynthesis cyclodehydratase domain-containing protein